MSILLKNIIKFFLFILVQAFVLDKVPLLHQYIKPSLYLLFILWLPFDISRNWLLIISFLFGLTMDMFSGTPGLHAAACVAIGFVRPFVLNALLPHEKVEVIYFEPSIRSMGLSQYAIYLLVLTFIHHFIIVLIEWMQFGSFFYFIGKVTLSTIISLGLMFITELIAFRKTRFRTNAE